MYADQRGRENSTTSDQPFTAVRGRSQVGYAPVHKRGLRLLEKLTDPNFECAGQFHQRCESQIFLAALNRSGERPGKAALMSEFLL
jgi:hypothetical protein